MGRLKWEIKSFPSSNEIYIPDWLDSLEGVVMVSMVAVSHPPSGMYIVVLVGCDVGLTHAEFMDRLAGIDSTKDPIKLVSEDGGESEQIPGNVMEIKYVNDSFARDLEWLLQNCSSIHVYGPDFRHKEYRCQALNDDAFLKASGSGKSPIAAISACCKDMPNTPAPTVLD